jgi:hypothetical protein
MAPQGMQMPGGLLAGPNAEQRLARVLGLDATQQNAVHTALDQMRVQLQGVTGNVADLRTQLAAAVRAGDTGKIDQLTQDLARTQQQQMAIQAKAMAAIYGTLNADQKARFDASLDRQFGVRPPRQPKGAAPQGTVQ